MTTPKEEMHALAVIHLVAMVGLLYWWSIYFWPHSPTREIFALRSPHHGRGGGSSVRGCSPAELAAVGRGVGVSLGRAEPREMSRTGRTAGGGTEKTKWAAHREPEEKRRSS